MGYEIVIKANDGRGLGHIARVVNFIGYPKIRNRIAVILNDGYQDMIRDNGIQKIPVEDRGCRVNLDQPRKNMPGSIIQKFEPSTKVKGETLNQAAAAYYENLLVLSNLTQLLYLDDQNGMEALFLEDIGKVIGEEYPRIRELMPNGKTAVEIETQYINDSPTRMRAVTEADFLHLSSDIDFLRLGAPKFSLGKSLDDKVIPMGFPLSDWTKDLLDAANLDKKTKKDEILERYKVKSQCNQFVYCNFGAGEGAGKLMNELYELAKDRPDTLFIITDPRRELIKEFEKDGKNKIKCKKVNKYDTQIGGLKNLYTVKNKDRPEHFDKVAVCDATIQGNGSGTTYESIYAQTPSVNIPLARPGCEQLIKGLAMKESECGELLIVEEMYKDRESTARLSNLGVGSCGLNKENLGRALEDIFSEKKPYGSNLTSWKPSFGTEYLIGETIDQMTQKKDPAEIRKKLGLKGI